MPRNANGWWSHDAVKSLLCWLGFKGSDWEDIVLQSSPGFWKLIQERREQPTISLKELKARLKKRKR
jgi:hypothetical protein